MLKKSLSFCDLISTFLLHYHLKKSAPFNALSSRTTFVGRPAFPHRSKTSSPSMKTI